GVHHAVAADPDLDARRIRCRADPPRLDLAETRATIPRRRVAVVARLAGLDDTVAALGTVEARGAGAPVGDAHAGVLLLDVGEERGRVRGRGRRVRDARRVG